MLNAKQIAELDDLVQRGGGRLEAEDVVARARNAKSALHDHPVWKGWDVRAAAEEYYREAARKIIRVRVTMVDDPPNQPREMRTYVSFSPTQSGYEETQELIRYNRTGLLERQLDKIENVCSSYPLPELDHILDCVKKIRDEIRKPPPKKGGGKPKGGEERPSKR